MRQKLVLNQKSYFLAVESKSMDTSFLLDLFDLYALLCKF